MADTTTTNLLLTKPEVGASTDTWGTKINTDLDSVDAVFAAAGTGTSVGLNVGSGKTLKVAGTTDFSANLTFTGTGNRITGDFSNATVANRAMFQTSTVNGGTFVTAFPNGTGSSAGYFAYGSSDTLNSSYLWAWVNGSSDVQFRSGISGTGTYLPMTFYTGGSERIRVDTSGNVGIGTSSPRVVSGYVSVGINGTSGGLLDLFSNGSRVATFGADSGGTAIGSINAAHLGFTTNNTERARIDSSGNLLVGATGQPVGGINARLAVSQPVADYSSMFVSTQSTAANCYGVRIQYTAAAPNGSGNVFLVMTDTGGDRVYFKSNGGLANYSANNTNLSDVRIKTDIQDAGSYLSKICSIPVRTFKYKDQTDDLLNLGVIAQEVESVAPELVDASGFGETPEDGVPLKAIYQTDLQYALMKCIQEQQALITTLTDRITALEAK
jgi:hypothetical protein